MNVIDAVRRRSNDYGSLDDAFVANTGRHLYDTGLAAECLAEDHRSLSVVIPYFNASQTIGLVLGALSRQVFPAGDLEVIIVDDGSSDDAASPLEELSSQLPFECRLVRHRRNFGRSSARNTGASLANNDVLLFLDVDAVVPPGLLVSHAVKHTVAQNILLVSLKQRTVLTPELRRQLIAGDYQFNLNPKGDWRYHGTLQIDGEPAEISNVLETDYFKRFGDGVNYYAKTLPEMVITVCLSVAREQFFSVGGFCERFVTYGREDIFFGAMAIACGVSVVPDLSVLCQLEDTFELTRKEDKKQERVESLRLYHELMEMEIEPLVKEGKAALAASKSKIQSVTTYGRSVGRRAD